MARIADGFSSGQTGSVLDHDAKVLNATSGDTLTLPGHHYVSDSQILRDGQDLILRPAHGDEITVKNYFSVDHAPTLNSADGGASLTPELVKSFVKPAGGIQYAQNGTIDDVSPVGAVKETSGEATVTHTNGIVEKAAIGTPIFEGDIVETKDHGAVNITFIDKTTFAVSENAKMAIDQYVFDPATQHGENNFSVLRGVFVFTSGLIGHADPDDVKINTPVGSIGIRGTTIMGTISPDGASHISVVEGAIVVSNAAGDQTLSQQFETVTLHGMNHPMTPEGVLSAESISNSYNVLRTVSAPLFSTFDDLGKTDNGQTPAGEAPAREESAPKNDAAPVNKSDAGQAAPAANNQEAAVARADLGAGRSSLDNDFETPSGLEIKTALISNALHSSTSDSLLKMPSLVQAATNAVIAEARSSFDISSSGEPSAGKTASLPPLGLVFHQSTIPTYSLAAGLVLGSIETTLAYNNVNFSFASAPGNGVRPYFNLVQDGPGHANLVLTNAGLAAIRNGDHIPFGITATLPDGRSITQSSEILVQNPVNATANIDINLNAVISGTGGRFIPGVSADSHHGANTAALGDYNHDGRMDYAFVDGASAAARLYIDDNNGNNYAINLANGPYNLSDTSALSIASAGDFNRDGKGDLVIGAYNADSGSQFNSGAVFIASGAAPGSAAISITGFDSGQMAGFSVSGVGDYNGDGFSDIIIGAPYSAGVGEAYILFGRSSTGSIDVGNLNASSGFKILGPNGTEFAKDVAGIGDFNKDGYGDFALCDPGSNLVSIHFGNKFGADTTPLTIAGFSAGASPDIVSLGDANGDGISDLGILDAVANKFYVFDGGSTRGAGSVSVSAADIALTSSTGSIISAGSAGDFNGDGNDDIMLAIRNGSQIDMYVVYGKSGLAGTIDPATMSDAALMHMTLDLTSSQFNLANPGTDPITLSLSSAGDLNNDGFNDILVGIPNIDSNGGVHSDDGGVAVIYGRAENSDLNSGLINLSGSATAAGQALIGTADADTLTNSNAAFNETSFHAGGGNDIINLYGNSAHLIDGGTGSDTLNLLGNGLIDLSAMTQNNLKGLETIQMTRDGATLKLGLDDIFSLMQDSQDHILRITDQTSAGSGSGTTALQIVANGSGFTLPGSSVVSAGGETYNDYAFGNYHLYVDVNVNTTAVV